MSKLPLREDTGKLMLHRRTLLSLLAWGTATASLRTALAQVIDIEEIRARWREFAQPGLNLPLPSTRLELSDSEWSARLQPLAYRVLRKEATEPAGSSELNEEHRSGLYVCAGCNLPLFSSEMKYESGTGWPSFFTTIPDVFETKRDFALLIPRTEYHCVRCDGHHGHVFNDGPEPTGERWCNNGAALRFIPRSA